MTIVLCARSAGEPIALCHNTIDCVSLSLSTPTLTDANGNQNS